MPGIVDDSTPSYISSQSADVILSDVRPFKLKTEALRAINVFLDEFLYSLLHNSASLSTDKLRGSLLSLLPTSLGKEALLEAEVELRAYWDRTTNGRGPTEQLEDDSTTFHLPWSYELLRLKCEAYSTLNESDEDPSVEDRIQEQFVQTFAVPPSATLLAPAALYLTAILEAMCEHILTNVGRVAARDSSRVSANVNDLFTALCEDDSIYGLFRSMRVYEQIELLSKDTVKSRRSKSFTRSELSNTLTTLTSRTGSPHQDLSLGKDSISIPRSRLSSEVSSSTAVPNMPGITTPASRTSIEKARPLKLFKNSLDSDNQNGFAHKKSESVISEKDDGQRSLTLTEDSVLQQEFDDLMRSSSTMKVSLTPDRLKTMEVYKQEKDMQTRRRPAPLASKDSDSVHSKRPSLRHVDSINEDDEELAFPEPPASNFSRVRQGSAVTPPSAAAVTASNPRTRSISTSSLGAHSLNTLSRNKQQSAAPSAYPHLPSNMTRPTKLELSGLPPRTRKRQGNRESLDLDDVMNGSEDLGSLKSLPSARPPLSPRSTGHVSSSTRDLMDFLAQGPPDDLGDNSYSGPPSSASFDARPKGDRLRRMISKLSIGNGEKSKGATYVPSKSQSTKPPPLPAVIVPTPPRPPRLADQNSLPGLASLANRPIPPRPPRPPTPPSDHEISPPPSPIKASAPITPYSPATSSFRSSNRPPSPALVPPRGDSRETSSRQLTINGSAGSSLNVGTNGHVNGQVDATASTPVNCPSTHGTNDVDTSPLPTQNSRVPTNMIVPPTPSGPDVGLSPSDVAHLYRLIQHATSADECRLILHAMLARHKISPQLQDATESTPNETVASLEDAALERSLTGYFLGEEGSPREGSPRVTSNRSSTISVASGAAYDNDSGVDAVDSTPPVLPPLSIGNHSNTLVGEMKA